MSPFSQWSWQIPPRRPRMSMVLAMNSSETMRLGRFLYVMKSLNDVTPMPKASVMPSRIFGSWFRMKWKPKSRTETDSASSRSWATALGSVSPSSYTTKGKSVVSPVWAAAMADVFQSSYSAPTWRWQSMSPGSTKRPVASMTRSAEGRRSSGPMAAILSPLMATAVSTISDAVTTLPPRTMVSTRGAPAGLIAIAPAWKTTRGGRASSSLRLSSVGLLLGHGLEEGAVVLGLPTPEEVPALAHRRHLVEIDARDDQLIARGGGFGEDLPLRADDARAADQLHAVLDARLGDAHHEAGVRVGACPHAELVQIEGQCRDGRVVADEDELRALQGEGAVALRIAPVLADGDAHLGATGVEDLVARIAVGEVVRLVDLGEAIRLPSARKVDLPECAAERARGVGEEGGVEVLAVGLLAEAHVHGDARFLGAAEQGLERLGRHLRLEELVEVLTDLLGEVRSERHLRIGDQLHPLLLRLLEEGEHALDDLLAARAFVVGAHLGSGDDDVAGHVGLLFVRPLIISALASSLEASDSARKATLSPSRGRGNRSLSLPEGEGRGEGGG